MFEDMWRRLKIWRRIRLGPVALHFTFRKAVPLTNGTHSKQQQNAESTRLQTPRSATSCPTAPLQHVENNPGTAVIVGVGPGFGYALARKLSAAGFDLALLTRNADRLVTICAELRANGKIAESYGMDATHETDVTSVFAKVVARHGPPSLVVYSLQEFATELTLDVTPPSFESSWRHNCLGAFLVSQAAGHVMKTAGQGSIILVGSTSSIIGREGHLNLAVGKFGQRALAQVLSRELWPLGIHVAHVLIDADITEPGSASTEPVHSDPNDIAYSILALHNQPRSAWSSEMDLRPWNEKFWEHC